MMQSITLTLSCGIDDNVVNPSTKILVKMFLNHTLICKHDPYITQGFNKNTPLQKQRIYYMILKMVPIRLHQINISMHQTFSTIIEILRHSSFCLENPHPHNTMLAQQVFAVSYLVLANWSIIQVCYGIEPTPHEWTFYAHSCLIASTN